MIFADKPYSAACERNRGPILEILRPLLGGTRSALEIGSGSGQHAVHFAAALPWLEWQCSDRAPQLPGIRAWLAEAALSNLPVPLELDVRRDWPSRRYDLVFTANTLHIMDWDEVRAMFAALPRVLEAHALLAIYGPFHYRGRATSESNAAFDRELRRRDPRQGIRDVEAVHRLASEIALEALADHPMPANNRMLVWRMP